MDSITCWIVTEGIAGTENQCLGVTESLGLNPEIKRIKLNFPWNLLSPYMGLENSRTCTPKLAPPWPDLLIASGRKSIAASRYIKKASKGKTFTVQIQDPRTSPKEFDLVAVPAHDRMRSKNVIVTTATPNRISEEKLAKAKKDFTSLSEIKSPRIAVLIGGKSKTHRLNPEICNKLSDQLSRLNAGLMVTASRRTGSENRKTIEEGLKNADAYIWEGSGKNPYFGFLAWADYIIVTADSASMLSEAASTGKPTYMIDMEGGSPKFNRLHQNLIDHGAIRKFEGKLEDWTYTPLSDSKMIAEYIKQKIGNH